MAKKKKLTPLEKQTEAYQRELYLRVIKVQKYDPDYLRKLRYDDFHDYKCMIAMAERARDAGFISEETFELGKRELAGVILSKVYLREHLWNKIESCISEEDPILPIKEQLKLPFELQIDLFTHVLNPFPNEWLPVHWSVKSDAGLRFHLDLRFTDNKIMKTMDRHLKYFLSPAGQSILDRRGWRPQLADGQIREVIRDPGKGPYTEDLESSMLIVSIYLNVGKMEIRKALKELLEKFSPRDTKSTPKFSPDTWETDYQIYVLHYEEGFTFKEIAAKLNMPASTVKSAFQRIYKHIHQIDEYGTAETRGELSVDITKGLLVPLDEAEAEYARSQILGGLGNKMAPSGAYEDEGGDFLVQEPKQDPVTGFFKLCNEIAPRTPRIYALREECVYLPGSEACSTCTPWRNSETFVGNMDGIPYFRRKFLPSTYPGTSKIINSIIQPDMVAEEKQKDHVDVGYKEYLAYWDWKHHWLLEQIAFARGYYYDYRYKDAWGEKLHSDLPRKEELSLQAEYVEKHGTVRSSPWEPPREEDDVAVRIVPHSSGQYSLAFTLRKDLLEWLIVSQIDQRAKKSHH